MANLIDTKRGNITVTAKIAPNVLQPSVNKLIKITSTGGITIKKPLEVIKTAQSSKKIGSQTKKPVDILGGIAGVAMGVALQNPLLSPDTNKKILIQSTEQGMTGGLQKVAGVVPAGLGGVVGFAISGKEGITQGVTQGPINTITNQVKEITTTVTNTIETIKEIPGTLGDLGKYIPIIILGGAALIGAMILTRRN